MAAFKISYEGRGVCSKSGYDENGKQTYYENSCGDWWRAEYDERGSLKYYENSDGFWAKLKYDERGSLKYYEDSNGFIRGTRKIRKNNL